MSKGLKIPNEFELAISYYDLLGASYYKFYNTSDNNENDVNSNEKSDVKKGNVVISMEETQKGPVLCSVSGNNNNKDNGNSSTKETMIESVMKTVEKCVIN